MDDDPLTEKGVAVGGHNPDTELVGPRQFQLPQQETPTMSPANYSVQERFRDGRSVKIRALRPDDETGMLVAIDRMGTESLRRRFFVTKREFSDKETAFFMNVDFVNHIALVAEIDENGSTAIVGGGRYVVVGTGQAEIAFIVVDAYQRQGIGAILVRHIVGLARAAGLKQLSADVLPENVAMLTVLGKFGFRSRGRDPQAVHLTLPLV
jgi:RimJ/RimL family protein N-acetyltransferase